MSAIEGPLADAQVDISGPELKRAAAATRGLAYAVQSIGAHLWRACGGPPGTITAEHVDEAVPLMEDDVADKVVTPVWSRLSPADKRFLFAMLPDEANSSLTSISDRLGKPSAHVHTYKNRLLDEGVITETPLGDLAFTSRSVRYRATQEQAMEDMAARESMRLNQQNPLLDATASSPPTHTSLCGAPMPRAKKPCVLPVGHSGPHRSVPRKPR